MESMFVEGCLDVAWLGGDNRSIISREAFAWR
jgi:hypothetical protein